MICTYLKKKMVSVGWSLNKSTEVTICFVLQEWMERNVKYRWLFSYLCCLEYLIVSYSGWSLYSHWIHPRTKICSTREWHSICSVDALICFALLQTIVLSLNVSRLLFSHVHIEFVLGIQFKYISSTTILEYIVLNISFYIHSQLKHWLKIRSDHTIDS